MPQSTTARAPAATPRMRETRIELPMQSRAAVIGSVRPDERRFDVCFTTGARVKRSEWQDYDRVKTFYEELRVAPDAMRMTRINSGAAPFLANHNSWSISGALGVVERAWIEAGKGYATIRMPEAGTDPDADRVFEKIRQGILRSVSVGYAVHKYEVSRDGDMEVRTAKDWEPYEISLVPIPADAGASVRSGQETRSTSCVVQLTATAWVNADEEDKEKDDMPVEDNTAVAETAAATSETRAAPVQSAPAAAQGSVQEAVLADRRRVAEITELTTRHGVGDLAPSLIADGISVDGARARVLDTLAERHGGATPRGVVERVTHLDSPDQVQRRMIDGIAGRLTQRAGAAHRIEITAETRPYAGLDLVGLGTALMRARGERVPQNVERTSEFFELMARSLSASDFAAALGAVANKILLPRYQAAPASFRSIFARRDFADFKPHRFIRVGDFPVPLEKGETSEYKVGALRESENQITLAEYGRTVPISRRMLINDDLGALSDMSVAAGLRIAAWQNAVAWALFALNANAGPTVLDPNINNGAGRPLFHSDHGNLAGAGTTIDVANVGAGRAAMMAQRSIGATATDGILLNVMPRYLVTGAARLTLAQQFCAVPIVAATDANANPFKGLLEPIGDANLAGNAWYLVADPEVFPCLIWGSLRAEPEPRFGFDTPFNTDGVRFKIAADLAVGAIDFRGIYRNPGA